MGSPIYLRLNAADRSYFAIIKKQVHALAASVGLSARRLGEIDIIVAEMVSNLAKHSTGGELLVKPVARAENNGIEIIAIDSGPGMHDVQRMMQDGASTKNTLGNGLGAIKRLSDIFQIFSQRGWGTIQLIRIYNKSVPVTKKADMVELQSLLVPKPGETECGDGFSMLQTPEHIKLFLGDGLGHGKEAASAVNTAIEAFLSCEETSPVDIIRFVNEAAKRTRGLVGTVAVFSVKARQWQVCGVGNIMTKFHGATPPKTHSPYNGIIGLNIPRSLKDTEIPFETGQILSLASDGIRSRWEALKLPGILRHDFAIFNAAIFKDFARNTDDTSIVTCKITL